MTTTLLSTAAAALFFTATVACAAPPSANFPPRIAVTEFAYQQRVSEYFEVAAESGQAAVNANPNGFSASQQYQGTYVAGSASHIAQGELRNFSSDLKGMILKGGGASLVQGRAFDAGAEQPSAAERALQQVQTGRMAKAPARQPDVNDIISRIRKREFAGADYVLFGEVASVEFRDELSPLQGTTTTSYIFGLDLGVNFNLINTKTYEVKSAFMATGAGSDVKLLSRRGDVVAPNRTKVIRQTSLTLAEDAYGQLLDQLGLVDPNFGRRSRGSSGRSVSNPAAPLPQPEPVTVLR